MPPKESSAPARGLGRKGSRASMACIGCRQRKIKCDVQHKAPGTRCTKCQNAQIPCAIEPGGDRRKCRVENSSESLSSLRGRMKALEDMLLKERGAQANGGIINVEESRDSEARDTPDASVASPAPNNTAAASSSAPSALSLDAASAMIDLQRTSNTSTSCSERRSIYEIAPSSYQYDTMPIDDLARLPTPNSPNFRSNGNNENDSSNDINNASTNDDGNMNHNDIFDINSFSCTEHHVPTAGNPSSIGQLPPPNTSNNTAMDHINMPMPIDNQLELHHGNDMSQIHEQSTQAANKSGPQIRTAMTPSHGDIDGATDTDHGRFYGPTSQTYLQSIHEESPVGVTEELETDIYLDIDSTEVRRLLFQSYWAVHTLAARVIVDKSRFMADRSIGKRSQYYSAFLENAILACATRTSTSSAMRDLGERFLERARADVLHELEHLNVASMQGFLLLSDYEATRGRDRLGWMYCGIACRSLYDLGLHENTKENQLGSIDIVNRHSVFLTSFVYDQLWSLYLGRPSSISLGYVRAARLAAKNVVVPEELDAWVSLCVQIAKVTETLNSSQCIDVKAYDRRLTELAADLDACFENLPARLRYEEGSSMHLDACAYALNVQHCGLRIVLHSNSLRLRQERRSELQGYTGQHGAEYERSRRQSQSTQIVHQSAVRVAKLIRTYKRIYGVEKIVTIMLDNMYVAATALITHILSLTNSTNSDKDVQWLRSLSETLEEVQKYYPITTVMITTLSRLVKGTTLSDTFRSRLGGSMASHDSPSAVLSTMPLLAEASWGSREPFMHGFTFNMGPVMDPTFGVDGDQSQYFQNPVIDSSPPWDLGLSRC